MKYGVSIGRRQPMHRLHVECIQEIVDAGLTPILIVGSTNSAGSKFFDPLRNPLTFAQQQEQIKAALPFVKNPEIIGLEDVGNLQRWCESVVALLKDRLPYCTMHYRTKQVDEAGGPIASLSASEEVFTKLGLKSWRTINKNPADDLLNSSDLRALPIDQLHDLAAPTYIRMLMQQAREENLDHGLLRDIPITMLDLTLMRLAREANISTASIWKKAHTPNWQGLKEALML